MDNSFGLLETKGVAAAFYGLDAMLKNTNVSYVGDEKNLGAGLATVIINGNLSAVRNAVEIAKIEAKKINEVLTASYISNPHPEVASFIYRYSPDYINTKNPIKKKESPDGKAIGFVEIYGYAASLISADAALKASNISLLALDKTKGKANTPGLIMFLKLAGNIDAVKVAVEVAVETAKDYNDFVSHTVIAQPDAMIKTMIKEGI